MCFGVCALSQRQNITKQIYLSFAFMCSMECTYKINCVLLLLAIKNDDREKDSECGNPVEDGIREMRIQTSFTQNLNLMNCTLTIYFCLYFNVQHCYAYMDWMIMNKKPIEKTKIYNKYIFTFQLVLYETVCLFFIFNITISQSIL